MKKKVGRSSSPAAGAARLHIEEAFFEKYVVNSSRGHVSDRQPEDGNFIDVLIFVPEESRAGKQVVSKAARATRIEYNLAVMFYYVEMAEPTFEKSTGDCERVMDELRGDQGLIYQGEFKLAAAVWRDKR
jgi:uncharacterized 2Fe-2S/4Fe-4S cluster protein (DUF4445 family)